MCWTPYHRHGISATQPCHSEERSDEESAFGGFNEKARESRFLATLGMTGSGSALGMAGGAARE